MALQLLIWLGATIALVLSFGTSYFSRYGSGHLPAIVRPLTVSVAAGATALLCALDWVRGAGATSGSAATNETARAPSLLPIVLVSMALVSSALAHARWQRSRHNPPR